MKWRAVISTQLLKEWLYLAGVLLTAEVSSRKAGAHRDVVFIGDHSPVLQQREPGVTHWKKKQWKQVRPQSARTDKMNWHTHRSLIFTAAQRLTLGLDEVPLLGAGLAVAVTADVIEGEEQMVLLVQLSRKLDLILKRRSTTQHFSSCDGVHDYTCFCPNINVGPTRLEKKKKKLVHEVKIFKHILNNKYP